MGFIIWTLFTIILLLLGFIWEENVGFWVIVVDEVGVVKAFRETGYGAGLVEICDLVELAVFG